MTSWGKSSSIISHNNISRRVFLAAGLAATAMCFLPCEAVASVLKVLSFERALSFDNIHTGEKMEAIYWQEGTYVPQALADINYILRDYRTGEVKEIDIRLPGYELNTLRSAAIDLRRGGVGYYPLSDFVHVDVGRIRSW